MGRASPLPHLIDFLVPGRRREWNLKKQLPLLRTSFGLGLGAKIGDEIGARLADD